MGFGQKQGRPDTEAALGEQQYQLSAQPQTSHRVRAGGQGDLLGVAQIPAEAPGAGRKTLGNSRETANSDTDCKQQHEQRWMLEFGRAWMAKSTCWALGWEVCSGVQYKPAWHSPFPFPAPSSPALGSVGSTGIQHCLGEKQTLERFILQGPPWTAEILSPAHRVSSRVWELADCSACSLCISLGPSGLSFTESQGALGWKEP